MKPFVLDEREERLEKFNFLLITFLFIFFFVIFVRESEEAADWKSFDFLLIIFSFIFI